MRATRGRGQSGGGQLRAPFRVAVGVGQRTADAVNSTIDMVQSLPQRIQSRCAYQFPSSQASGSPGPARG